MILEVVIPAKGFAAGKTRLSTLLAPGERAALNRRFLDHVLDVVAATPGIDRAVVVSADRLALEHARRRGARTLAEPGGGLNDALRQAARAARAAGADAVLVLPTDLPLLTPADVAAVIADEPGVVIAPDRGGTGTNALFVSPPDRIPFRFGPGSFARHEKAAGAAARIVRRPNLAFDIDTPDDYRDWIASTASRTHR